MARQRQGQTIYSGIDSIINMKTGYFARRRCRICNKPAEMYAAYHKATRNVGNNLCGSMECRAKLKILTGAN